MTKSELSEYEVYLMDYLGAPRQPIPGVKCVCYLRPSVENIELLRTEFRITSFCRILCVYHFDCIIAFF